MASQVLCDFKVKVEVTQPFMLRDILPGPGWAPYRAPPIPFEREMEYESDADVVGGSCVRGLLTGICLEGIMALGIYGAWQVWHLLR
jgi:hypothetical protein